ncbi:MAG: inositol monophosphatase [Alphaproteobacteria bacterium]|nr:inositol monophosphatase [Alphaproteobacteria bacterium]
MANPSALVTVMIKAAEKAAKKLVRDFGELENLQVSKKGPADFVSRADIMAEKTIKEELLKARSDFGFLGEESEPHTGSINSRFIVDPIDGTTNFLHGIPQFCISIAAEVDGQIKAGVILDPIKHELFWAEKGLGAYCNGKRLRVAGRTDLSEALLVIGTPFAGHGDADAFIAFLKKTMGNVAGFRRMGSAALDLAYVAMGRFDMYYETHLKPWDVAAGILLVEEAKGIVTDSTGGNDMLKNGSILAANPILHPLLRNLLR